MCYGHSGVVTAIAFSNDGQTLASVSEAAMAAAMAMQGADMAPTAGQVAAVAKARADVKAMTDQWSALKASSPVK